ncbi:MAG TPA: PAS-domain containing protein, partial [Xanthobacteraceae bacterium]|nr:PAS-domain containing protein [Xanthobacteraceae bacterium]
MKPGCTIRGLVEHRIAQGTFFEADPEQYIAELTSALQIDRKPSRKTLELSDGRVIAVLSQPMAAGGWVVTHEDVTERHRAEKELEKTRNFLHTVIENVPVPIIVKNAGDRRYVLINRPVEEHFGLSRDQMIGRTAHDVFSKSDADIVDQHDNRLLATR